MNEPTGLRFDELAPELARRIDAVCRRFEADWRAGKRRPIDDYLGDVPEEGRPALRAELEALERELRPAGETIARPEAAPSSTVAEAPTIVPGAPATLPSPGAAPANHADATLPPHVDATVDLGRAEPAQAEAPSPARIRYFGDYEIVRELARGGMGVVFQARQVSLNRPVALKMILAGQLANQTDVKRFYTEAEAAANLDHPGIVPIFEVGQYEGQHYFSMGFVEGQSLAQKLAGGPLPPREAAALMAKVAEAIAYAHQRGVIHRDLKPANILLDRAGHPRVTDFGLAKKLEGDSGLTGSGQIMGTPSYMPPEQAGGKRGEVGPAADVYALGATLYALITGRPPFQAATAMDTVLQVISDEPVPPRRLNASVPLDLETVCLKCLEKEQGKRYVSASALGEDLRRYLAGEPIRARPVGRPERAWRWCRRNPVVAGLAGGIAMALALGTVVATYFAVRADQAAQRTQEEKQVSDRRLYIAEMNLAQRAWQEGNLDLLQTRLKSYLPKQWDDPDRRGFEWYYLDRLPHLELRTLTGHVQSRGSVVYSPDGRTLAFDGDDGIVTLCGLASGDTFVLAAHRRPYDHVRPAYSPDGRILATVSSDRGVQLWDTATGTEVRSLSGNTGVVTRLKFSPDGRILATAAARDRAVRLWDTASGKEARSLSGASSWILGLAYSPDGRLLAVTGFDYTVQLWDTATGKAVRTLPGRSGTVTRVLFSEVYDGSAFSPDGRILAAAAQDALVQLWDTATGKVVRTFRGHAGIIERVLYSPDGRSLLSASSDQTVKLWEVATGQELRTLRANPGTSPWPRVSHRSDGRPLASIDTVDVVWDAGSGKAYRGFPDYQRRTRVSYSPDGRTLASADADNTVQFWDAATGKAVRTLRSPRGAIDVQYSPDGRTLAILTSDRAVELWDANTTDETVVLRGHSGTVARVAYSPDGRTLASAGEDKTVRLWDAATGAELRTLRGHAGAVLGVAINPDGRTLASASADNTVKLWDVATGKEIETLSGHGDAVHGVAISPDGRTLASASADNTVMLWDAATGAWYATLSGHKFAVDGVAYSPDGRVLASAGADSSVKLWDTSTRKEVRDLAGYTVSKSFDVKKRQVIETFSRAAGHAFDGIVAYSPDGHTLATTALSPQARADHGENAVQLWDASGKEVGALVGHVGAVFGVAFSPDGRRVATASADGTVKLWDTITGQEALTLHGHVNEFKGVAFSPDGYQLACACGDGTVKVWDARPLTPEVQTTREARSVVEFLLARKLPADEVLARIRRDPTIGAEVRRRALDLAGPRVQAMVNDEADRLVRSLFDKLFLKDDVLERLRADTALSEPLREQALALAERSADDPNRLNEASWAVVRRADAGAAAYRVALRQAEAACRLSPENANLVNTLGVAQYRAGKDREAVATLTRSDQLHSRGPGGSVPADLAFLALAQHRLGQAEKARDTLRRLRETMKKPERAKNPEAQAFLREAQAIEQDLVFPADPFAP